MLIGYLVFQEIQLGKIKKNAEDQLLDTKAKHAQEIIDITVQTEKKMDNIRKRLNLG
mgnify:CR=1 FL=1